MACDEGSRLTFRDFFHRDVENPCAWFDPSTFGRWLDIDGRKILGVMVKSRASMKESDPSTEGYANTVARLYLKSRDVTGVNAGQSIRVEGHAYQVLGHDITGGQVVRIDLGSADG